MALFLSISQIFLGYQQMRPKFKSNKQIISILNYQGQFNKIVEENDCCISVGIPELAGNTIVHFRRESREEEGDLAKFSCHHLGTQCSLYANTV